MMLRILFFFVLFFAVSISAHAQTANQFIKAGDRAYSRQDFISAISYYTSALRQGANELDYGFKLAESHRQFHNYKEAIKWYKNTIEKDQENKFPLANFCLAMVLKKEMQYEQAGNYLNSFIQNPGNADDFYKTKAQVEVQALQIAPQIINDSLPVEIERLSDRINSPYSEFAPFSENENKIYFSSIRYLTRNEISDGEKFYISKILTSQKTDQWSRPRVLTGYINVDNEHTSNAVLSRNGELMFFTRCNAGYPADVKCRIMYSQIRNNRWQRPVELPEKINLKNYTNTQPSIAEDKNGNHIIYFASDRPGGSGNMDIWYTMMDADGNFSDPVNAGNIINTPGDEVTPFYHDSTGTLYFSSDYHIGIGGFDIFSNTGEKNNWSQPVNAGYPLNSGYDDLSFTLTGKDSLTGFLGSNRPGSATITGESCCYDIYSFIKKIPETLPVTTDTLIIARENGIESPDYSDPETKAGLDFLKSFLPLDLYFHNDEPDPRTLKTSTNKNYEETFNEYVKLKNEYREKYSGVLEGNAALQADASIIRFFEEEVENGMQNLEEFTAILLQRLKAGDSFTLKLKGYTSPLSNTNYNANLARRRISSLINYFHQFQNGALLEFINKTATNNAELILIEEPIGEVTAPANVSDDLSDTRKSVYSPEAAAERRIEIIAVDINR